MSKRLTRYPKPFVVGVLAAVTVGFLATLLPATATAATASPPRRPEWFPSPARTAPIAADGAPRDARLTIPRIGIHRMPVIAYRGRTDDAPGTRIQNRGIAAASYGPHGGVGPGGIGNYQVAGHRSSHGAPFRRTPSLPVGAHLYVDVDEPRAHWRYVYRVVGTRWVDFRSAASLRRQRAAVPGHPGATPHLAWMTLSTCATPEDHARGEFWHDRFGNPRHRIDKIAVLVRREARP